MIIPFGLTRCLLTDKFWRCSASLSRARSPTSFRFMGSRCREPPLWHDGSLTNSFALKAHESGGGFVAGGGGTRDRVSGPQKAAPRPTHLNKEANGPQVTAGP